MIYTKKTIGTIAYMGGIQAVLERFCWAWGQMIQFNTEYLCKPGEIIHYAKATVSFHSFARNSIVEQMIGDWLLMLDTDHAFEPDLACRMVNAMNKYNVDVLGATYCHRTPPNSPVLYQWNKDKTGLEPIGDWDDRVEAFEVGSMGAGALLVKKSVYNLIRNELKEAPFEIIPPFGEDHSFFKRLDKLGIKAYAMPKIESPHLDIKVLEIAGFDRMAMPIVKKKEVEGFK